MRSSLQKFAFFELCAAKGSLSARIVERMQGTSPRSEQRTRLVPMQACRHQITRQKRKKDGAERKRTAFFSPFTVHAHSGCRCASCATDGETQLFAAIRVNACGLFVRTASGSPQERRNHRVAFSRAECALHARLFGDRCCGAQRSLEQMFLIDNVTAVIVSSAGTMPFCALHASSISWRAINAS